MIGGESYSTTFLFMYSLYKQFFIYCQQNMMTMFLAHVFTVKQGRQKQLIFESFNKFLTLAVNFTHSKQWCIFFHFFVAIFAEKVFRISHFPQRFSTRRKRFKKIIRKFFFQKKSLFQGQKTSREMTFTEIFPAKSATKNVNYCPYFA